MRPPEPHPRRSRLAGLAVATTLALGAMAGGTPASARDIEISFGGHAKYRFHATTVPSSSFLRDFTDSPTLDQSLEVRTNLDVVRGPWKLDAAYQLTGLTGDTLAFSRDLPAELQAFYPRYPQDDGRFLNLTYVIHDKGRWAAVQRLDRLSLGFASAKVVLRAGRQALSWGNGLVYSAMDILNPFDPAAIDKEYKTGDDMLYAQYLRSNGDDIQAVAALRRDPASGAVRANVCSFALKYHAIADNGEADILLAHHFGDDLAGVGGNLGLGGAVWRADLVATRTARRTVLTGVTSLSYSWVLGGKNVNGLVEYFFNGYGQPGRDYAPASLAANPELTARFVRGELFTLGRHYLAGSAMVELHPLFQVTPTIFTNLSDGSLLLQVATRNDLKENLALLGAFSAPLGAEGTEYGGIDSGVPGRPLSTGPSLFLQLGLYF